MKKIKLRKDQHFNLTGDSSKNIFMTHKKKGIHFSFIYRFKSIIFLVTLIFLGHTIVHFP